MKRNRCYNIQSEKLTFDIDVNQLREYERHGPGWGPRHLLVHDGNNRLVQEIRQDELAIAVVRYYVLVRKTGNHDLQRI